MINRESAVDIQAQICALIPSPRLRRILAYYLFDGLTQQQIADLENTPRRTIAHWLAKTRRILADAGLRTDRRQKGERAGPMLYAEPAALDRLCVTESVDGRARATWVDSDKIERRD